MTEPPATLERLLGRMEKAVETLEKRLPELSGIIEHHRQERIAACEEHWAVTNALQRSIVESNAANAKIAADVVTVAAKVARETLDDAAKVAREKLQAERQEHHWIVERIIQISPLLYMIGGGIFMWLLDKNIIGG